MTITVITGDLGSGKTFLAECLQKQINGCKIQEVSSEAEVKSTLEKQKSKTEQIIFVCSPTFTFGLSVLARLLKCPINDSRLTGLRHINITSPRSI